MRNCPQCQKGVFTQVCQFKSGSITRFCHMHAAFIKHNGVCPDFPVVDCDFADLPLFQCNKIVCPHCSTTSCYICRQVITGYDHFDMNRPDEVALSDHCQLWDPVELRYDQEVRSDLPCFRYDELLTRFLPLRAIRSQRKGYDGRATGPRRIPVGAP